MSGVVGRLGRRRAGPLRKNHMKIHEKRKADSIIAKSVVFYIPSKYFLLSNASVTSILLSTSVVEAFSRPPHHIIGLSNLFANPKKII